MLSLLPFLILGRLIALTQASHKGVSSNIRTHPELARRLREARSQNCSVPCVGSRFMVVLGQIENVPFSPLLVEHFNHEQTLNLIQKSACSVATKIILSVLFHVIEVFRS